MLVRDIVVLETVTRSAPLGVQFWDAVDARTVSDGLMVATFAPDEPRRRLLASATPHDVFLIGMMVVVEVHDLYGRFLPFTWTPPMASPLQPGQSLHRLHWKQETRNRGNFFSLHGIFLVSWLPAYSKNVLSGRGATRV